MNSENPARNPDELERMLAQASAQLHELQAANAQQQAVIAVQTAQLSEAEALKTQLSLIAQDLQLLKSERVHASYRDKSVIHDDTTRADGPTAAPPMTKVIDTDMLKLMPKPAKYDGKPSHAAFTRWVVAVTHYLAEVKVPALKWLTVALPLLESKAADCGNRYSNENPLSGTFDGLVAYLKACCVPTNCAQQAFDSLATLKQGQMTVSDFNKKFQDLADEVPDEYPGRDAQLVLYYRRGLRWPLQRGISEAEIHQNTTLDLNRAQQLAGQLEAVQGNRPVQMYQPQGGHGGYRRPSHMSVDRAGFRRMNMDDETYKKCITERRCFSCHEKDKHKDNCPRANTFSLGQSQRGRFRWYHGQQDGADENVNAGEQRDE
jgi:hypothetical protein